MKQLVILALLVAIVIISGCMGNTPYNPAVSFKLSESDITASDGQASDLVDIDIRKLDDNNIPVTFDIIFTSSNLTYLTILDDDNKPIEKITTRELTIKGAADKKQFRIVGKKVGGQPESQWILDVALLYNNTKISKKTLPITVK